MHILLAVIQFTYIENVKNTRKMETGILTGMKTCFDQKAFGLIVSKLVQCLMGGLRGGRGSGT